MLRFAFHVLIALTLALNGFSAPLAMAHADHGQPALETQDVTPALAAQHAHPCHEDVAGDKATESSSGVPLIGIEDEPSGKSCCGSAACQCGCVLSFAVPFTQLALTSHAVTATRSILISPPPALIRGTPPFRPPAA